MASAGEASTWTWAFWSPFYVGSARTVDERYKRISDRTTCAVITLIALFAAAILFMILDVGSLYVVLKEDNVPENVDQLLDAALNVSSYAFVNPSGVGAIFLDAVTLMENAVNAVPTPRRFTAADCVWTRAGPDWGTVPWLAMTVPLSVGFLDTAQRLDNNTVVAYGYEQFFGNPLAERGDFGDVLCMGAQGVRLRFSSRPDGTLRLVQSPAITDLVDGGAATFAAYPAASPSAAADYRNYATALDMTVTEFRALFNRFARPAPTAFPIDFGGLYNTPAELAAFVTAMNAGGDCFVGSATVLSGAAAATTLKPGCAYTFALVTTSAAAAASLNSSLVTLIDASALFRPATFTQGAVTTPFRVTKLANIYQGEPACATDLRPAGFLYLGYLTANFTQCA